MMKPVAMALLMSGCVFGAETDVVSSANSIVRIHEVRAQTGEGMRPVRDATFIPDFETGANELSFDGEDWSGTINFENLAETIRLGGGESILIERSSGAEMQAIQVRSEVEPFSDQSGGFRFDRRATMTFVTFIDNEAVEVVVELDLSEGYDC